MFTVRSYDPQGEGVKEKRGLPRKACVRKISEVRAPLFLVRSLAGPARKKSCCY